MAGWTMGSVYAPMIARSTKYIEPPIGTLFPKSSSTTRPTRVVERLHNVICRGEQARDFKADHGGRYWHQESSLMDLFTTCTYTVSFFIKLVRIGVAWRNASMLIVFHELLYEPDRLTFISVDEKPK